METDITYESDFYCWLVEYLLQLGPVKMYPSVLVEAADLALNLTKDAQDDIDEGLGERSLHPSIDRTLARREQALSVVFHLAHSVPDQSPYSELVIEFLKKCYSPPGMLRLDPIEVVYANRIGFKVAGLHRTSYFEEYWDETDLHLITTDRGRDAVGVSIHLRYQSGLPFLED